MVRFLKKIKKNEKGSVTLFVLTTMLFLSLILLSIYEKTLNKINNQNKMISEIESRYSTENGADMEQRYKEATNNY